MNFALKSMNFVLKSMNFASKSMNFVLKSELAIRRRARGDLRENPTGGLAGSVGIRSAQNLPRIWYGFVLPMMNFTLKMIILWLKAMN